jgi:hypothetical protein
MLTKAEILASDDRATVVVDVPEWGGQVTLKVMSAEQRDDYEQALFHNKDGDRIANVRASLVAACAIDDEGNPMFAPGDVSALGSKNATAVNRLFEAAQHINKMTDEDMEDLAGN